MTDNSETSRPKRREIDQPTGWALFAITLVSAIILFINFMPS